MKLRKPTLIVVSIFLVVNVAEADRISDLQDSIDEMRVERLDREYERLWELQMKQLRSSQPTPQSSPPVSSPYVSEGPFKYMGKSTEGVIWAVDTRSILKSGNEVMFKVHTASDHPRYYQNSVYFGSVLSMKMDCNAKLVSFDSEDLYPGRDRMGAKIGTAKYDKKMITISGNSMSSLVYSYICR